MRRESTTVDSSSIFGVPTSREGREKWGTLELLHFPAMLVKILGSAAGGGFPQWNCACANCRALRAGTFRGKARTQAQVAISADSRSWFLLGASPDLRAQIEATAGTSSPRRRSASRRSRERCSPTPTSTTRSACCCCANCSPSACMRPIHSPHSDRRQFHVRHAAARSRSGVLDQLCAGNTFPAQDPAGKDSGLRCRALSLGTHYPAYVSPQRQSGLTPREASLGLIVEIAVGKTSRLHACRSADRRGSDERTRIRRRAAVRRHILERR